MKSLLTVLLIVGGAYGAYHFSASVNGSSDGFIEDTAKTYNTSSGIDYYHTRERLGADSDNCTMNHQTNDGSIWEHNDHTSGAQGAAVAAWGSNHYDRTTCANHE